MLPTRVGELCAKADRPSACGRKRKEDSISTAWNASSVWITSCLFTRSEGAPRSGPLGQHDRGGLHKSPRRALLEAPLHFSGTPLRMGTTQPAFAQSNACARQTEPAHRHAVTEQHLLRRVDSICKCFRRYERSLARQMSTFSPSKDNSHCLTYSRRTWMRWPTIGPTSSFMHFPQSL